MKYYVSTIADVDSVASGDGLETLVYKERTAPLVRENSLGIELAEFCITENLDEGFEKVLPHIMRNMQASEDRTLHAPFCEMLVASVDPLVVQAAWKRYKQSYEFCKQFGAKKMIVHAGYYEELFFPSWFIAKHIEFWKRFLSEADDDIIICIENTQENDPELILGVLRAIDDPRLRMCLDIGHANLTPLAPSEWIKVFAPYISHYHLHNNYGAVAAGRRSMGDKHLALGDGIIDMKAVLSLAEELTPESTAAIESYQPEECVLWLKENGFI